MVAAKQAVAHKPHLVTQTKDLQAIYNDLNKLYRLFLAIWP